VRESVNNLYIVAITITLIPIITLVLFLTLAPFWLFMPFIIIGEAVLALIGLILGIIVTKQGEKKGFITIALAIPVLWVAFRTLLVIKGKDFNNILDFIFIFIFMIELFLMVKAGIAEWFKNNKGKLIIFTIIFVLFCAYIYCFPDSYKYNERWIVGKTEDEITAKYGQFDFDDGRRKGYKFNPKDAWPWLSVFSRDYNHYWIRFDENGFAQHSGRGWELGH